MSLHDAMSNGTQDAGARAFVRSLNILVKSVGLYGLGHSAEQFRSAWDELQTQTSSDGGFVLGVAGSQLLGNGSTLESGPAERSFAALLSGAGVASIHFAAHVTQDDFRRLVTAFAGAKKGALAEQLKAELAGGDGTIRMNAMDNVTADAAKERNRANAPTPVLSGSAPAPETSPLAADAMLDDQLPKLIEGAITAPQIPAGLTALLQRMAQPAAMHLATRFSKCGRRAECLRIIELFGATGAEGVLHLREVLRSGPAAEAATTVGLLSRYGATQLERLLHGRIASWNKTHHDAVVRQLACADSPERGRLLAKVFTQLDSMVLPEALDEISMCGDAATGGLLLRLAAGEVAQSADPYLRVKAIEGLGRMREKRAIPLLRELAGARQMFRWAHPDELRIVSLQALDKMDPQWARAFLPQSGVRERDLALAPLDAAADAPWARQRRYSRVSLPRAVSAVATTPRGEVPLETTLLSLGGGMGSASAAVQPGTQARIRLRSGLRTLNVGVVVREAPRQQVGFEIVEIALEDRTRLRRMLSGIHSTA